MSISLKQNIWLKELIFNLFALLIIYLVPLLSGTLQIPIYYIDPMRLLIILAIAHTGKRNAYILAIILPAFSFVISSHPSVFKMLLIILELVLNIWLFFYLWKRMKTIFTAMLTSIIIAKIFYYVLKFLMIQADLIQTDLFSTPWLAQVIMALAFSMYIWIILGFFRQSAKGPNL